MGFFSFLKKKNEAPASAPAAVPRPQETSFFSNEAERERQRDIARATAAKIDAIELEMTTDMFADTEAAWGSARRAPAAATTGTTVAEAADVERSAGDEELRRASALSTAASRRALSHGLAR